MQVTASFFIFAIQMSVSFSNCEDKVYNEQKLFGKAIIMIMLVLMLGVLISNATTEVASNNRSKKVVGVRKNGFLEK